MGEKKDSIARFIWILQPIQELYNLPPNSVHIFYKLAGGTIAFNRNASIFLNLRYFETQRMFHSTSLFYQAYQNLSRL